MCPCLLVLSWSLPRARQDHRNKCNPSSTQKPAGCLKAAPPERLAAAFCCLRGLAHLVLTALPWEAYHYYYCCCFFVLFCFVLPCHSACGILVPRPGIEPMSPAVGTWSLNHWTPREVPVVFVSVLQKRK